MFQLIKIKTKDLDIVKLKIIPVDWKKSKQCTTSWSC